MSETEKLPRIAKFQQTLVSYFPLFVLLMVFIIWFAYYGFGFASFNKNNAVSIFSSVIQGMSALLSVSIAVIIFRIQSLENRNQQLEESTLNFVFQTARLTYPKWIPSLEEDIRNGALAKRYFIYRVDTLNRTVGLSKTDHEKIWKELEEDRDMQQKRLEEILNLHTMTEHTIQRIRNGVINSIIWLIMPILFSFLFLMVTDAWDVSLNFVFVSVVVLMSASGTTVLIKTVIESTAK